MRQSAYLVLVGDKAHGGMENGIEKKTKKFPNSIYIFPKKTANFTQKIKLSIFKTQ